MALIATINTAEIRDHGFVTEARFNQLERSYEDAVGNGQFGALIEGITHDEASADDSPWFTNSEKPGRAITIDAETYEDLAEAVTWVSENYDVFSTHVETDEPQPPTYRVQEGYDGWSYLEVVRDGDDETMARWSLAEGAYDRATAERLAAEAIAVLENHGPSTQVRQTTGGHAALRDGRVTIRFGLLNDQAGQITGVEEVEVDVTVYVRALLRDLAIASVELDALTSPEA